ncbi:MAG TPA: serpin family protein [Bacteroidales bacterium]|nr:serpin family protein [Bacteroidales bacterium]
MKTLNLFFTAGLVSLVLLCACKTNKNNMSTTSTPSEENSPAFSIAESHNRFAFDLYKNISTKPENMFYSPYSISTAMAMTYTGARGNTEKQMGAVMHFPPNSMDFNNQNNAGLKEINALNDGNALNTYTANSIWAQKDFKFKENFIGALKDSYLSSLHTVDFIKETEQSRLLINKWVETETKEKIKDLIQPGLIDYLTRMVLVNAIYFKADWETAFDGTLTKKMPFFQDETKQELCDFMFAERDFKFYEQEDGLKAIEVPYSKGKMSMLVILPKDINGIFGLTKETGLDWYNKINSGLAMKKVKLWLPKFKTTSEFELSEMLQQMGMKDAFTDNADFSGMTGKKDLKISKVIHKAFVEVNEAGTEAAAATAVVMRVKSMPVNQPEFKADHPFLFIIKENTQNRILFMGNIFNPAK